MVEQLMPWQEPSGKRTCSLQFAKHNLSGQLLVTIPKLSKAVKIVIPLFLHENMPVIKSLSPSFFLPLLSFSALCTLLTQVCNEVSAS